MKHFSGNFWWTTAAYYRTLPDEIAADDYIGARELACLLVMRPWPCLQQPTCMRGGTSQNIPPG